MVHKAVLAAALEVVDNPCPTATHKTPKLLTTGEKLPFLDLSSEWPSP